MRPSAPSGPAPPRPSRRRRAAALGLLTGVLGLLLAVLPPGLDLEQALGLDLLFRARGAREPPPDVAIVSLDRATATLLELPLDPARWPRALHADLIDRLAGAGAAVIVFDILFEHAREAADDRRLADAIGRAGNVILAEYLRRDTLAPAAGAGAAATEVALEARVTPLAALARAAMATAPFPLPKVPVRVDQYWTFKRSAGDTPTLPVVALQAFALDAYPSFVGLLAEAGVDAAARLPRDVRGLEAPALEGMVAAVRGAVEADPAAAARARERVHGTREVTGTGHARRLRALAGLYLGPESRFLDFYGPPRTVPTIPYHRALAPGDPDGLRAEVGGKVVFVGTSELLRPEQKDTFHTVFSDASGADLSGVEIAATAFANLAEARAVRPLALGWHVAVLLGLGFVLGALGATLPPAPAAAATLAVAALYGFAATRAFEVAALWCPVVVPFAVQAPVAFVSATLWRYAETNRERLRVRRAFSYYLPDGVIEQLTTDLTGPGHGQEVVYGVCLATDAERYTGLAERLPPEALARLMNEYYGAVFEPIRRRGGVVSDVVGDAALAIWASPGPERSASVQAGLAACDIVRAVEAFGRAPERPSLPTRIGLHAGPIVLGHVGAIDHYEYRAVGDIVNTATRIQGLNKRLGTRVLVSQEVALALEPLLTRRLGRFLLAGKSRPIAVHELVGPRAESDPWLVRRAAAFEAALAAYEAADFARAERLFAALLDAYGEDAPARLYAEASRRLDATGPGDGWDAVVRVDEK